MIAIARRAQMVRWYTSPSLLTANILENVWVTLVPSIGIGKPVAVVPVPFSVVLLIPPNLREVLRPDHHPLPLDLVREYGVRFYEIVGELVLLTGK
jgi:hypothetical protein